MKDHNGNGVLYAKIGSYTSVNESEWTLLTGSFMLNEFDISGKSKALKNLVFRNKCPKWCFR